MRAVKQAEQEYAVALVAYEDSETLVEAVNAAIEAAAGAVPPSLTSAQLQELLAGALTQTGVGRVAEQIATDEVVRELLATTPGDAPERPALFQTSSLGRQVPGVQRARPRRGGARVEPAALAHQGAPGGRARPQRDRSGTPAAAARGSAGARRSRPRPRRPGRRRDRPRHGGRPLAGVDAVDPGARPALRLQRVGAVDRHASRGKPVGRHVPHPGVGVGAGSAVAVFADGLQYPGLLALADGHGRYLYDQFAREFFVNDPGACPAPLVFDAARYDTVDTVPDGPERSKRLAEMKLLAIVFFQTLEADPTAIGSSGDPLVDRTRETLRTLLGLRPEDDIVAAFLASQPPTSPPDGELPQATAPADPAQQALAAFAAEREARDAAAKLATMVTDLDLLISQVTEESFDDSAAGLAARFAAEDLKFAIQQQQTAVSKQYATFLEHAAGQTALVAEVNADYEARIKQLVEWPPPARQLPTPTP